MLCFNAFQDMIPMEGTHPTLALISIIQPSSLQRNLKHFVRVNGISRCKAVDVIRTIVICAEIICV